MNRKTTGKATGRAGTAPLAALPLLLALSAFGTQAQDDDLREAAFHGHESLSQEDLDTALLYAVGAGDTERVRRLIETGADPESRNSRGQTPLIRAAIDGHTDAMIVLIEHGADLESAAQDRWLARRALHWAAALGRTRAALVLIDRGADLDARDRADWTPLQTAAGSGRTDTALAMIGVGADPEAKERHRGQTALHIAFANGWAETALAMIGAGADPEARDLVGFTPRSMAPPHLAGHIRRMEAEAEAELSPLERFRRWLFGDDDTPPLHAPM